jgi:hypothetical protein
MPKAKIFRFIIGLVVVVGLVVSILYSINTWKKLEIAQLEIATLANKHRGAHVFGYLNQTNLKPLQINNYNWITMVSYAGQKDFDSPSMHYYRGDSLAVIRRDSTWKSQINIAHSSGFKVFMKPHLWLDEPSKGKWRSDIFPTTEENWKLWSETYREYILMYAKIAETNKVELFCIGTELSRLSVEKTEFWKALIADVKNVYTGKITYAANWSKEYEKITFWNQLDYIGVQAYFPLVKNNYPSIAQISNGWQRHFPLLDSLHQKYNRKILFTEIGYKSTADGAIRPWQWIEDPDNLDKILSNETQANSYQAFFDSVWHKDWFAGVHIWQLRSDYEPDKLSVLDFTPQGKPAEIVIAKGFE